MNTGTSWGLDLGTMGDTCLLDVSSILGPELSPVHRVMDTDKSLLSQSRQFSTLGMEWATGSTEAVVGLMNIT